MRKGKVFLLAAICALALTAPAAADVIWTPEPGNGALGAGLKIFAAVLAVVLVTAALIRHFRKR